MKRKSDSANATFEATLKELKGEEGGCLKGRHPKLNSHCWNDMKLAAGKKPDLAKRDVILDSNIEARGVYFSRYEYLRKYTPLFEALWNLLSILEDLNEWWKWDTIE